jgi:hypothetical protein
LWQQQRIESLEAKHDLPAVIKHHQPWAYAGVTDEPRNAWLMADDGRGYLCAGYEGWCLLVSRGPATAPGKEIVGWPLVIGMFCRFMLQNDLPTKPGKDYWQTILRRMASWVEDVLELPAGVVREARNLLYTTRASRIEAMLSLLLTRCAESAEADEVSVCGGQEEVEIHGKLFQRVLAKLGFTHTGLACRTLLEHQDVLGETRYRKISGVRIRKSRWDQTLKEVPTKRRLRVMTG